MATKQPTEQHPEPDAEQPPPQPADPVVARFHCDVCDFDLDAGQRTGWTCACGRPMRLVNPEAQERPRQWTLGGA